MPSSPTPPMTTLAPRSRRWSAATDLTINLEKIQVIETPIRTSLQFRVAELASSNAFL
jgi:hypothetical protein